jgi:hypothetical protein
MNDDRTGGGCYVCSAMDDPSDPCYKIMNERIPGFSKMDFQHRYIALVRDNQKLMKEMNTE